jgi:hypothetical protein
VASALASNVKVPVALNPPAVVRVNGPPVSVVSPR